jgi:hypothetical protein
MGSNPIRGINASLLCSVSVLPCIYRGAVEITPRFWRSVARGGVVLSAAPVCKVEEKGGKNCHHAHVTILPLFIYCRADDSEEWGSLLAT